MTKAEWDKTVSITLWRVFDVQALVICIVAFGAACWSGGWHTIVVSAVALLIVLPCVLSCFHDFDSVKRSLVREENR
jgi:hypothetical protein